MDGCFNAVRVCPFGHRLSHVLVPWCSPRDAEKLFGPGTKCRKAVDNCDVPSASFAINGFHAHDSSYYEMRS